MVVVLGYIRSTPTEWKAVKFYIVERVEMGKVLQINQQHNKATIAILYKRFAVAHLNSPNIKALDQTMQSARAEWSWEQAF